MICTLSDNFKKLEFKGISTSKIENVLSFNVDNDYLHFNISQTMK